MSMEPIAPLKNEKIPRRSWISKRTGGGSVVILTPGLAAAVRTVDQLVTGKP